MVVVGRRLLFRNTVSSGLLIKWSLCTGFLKKSACQIWHENYLGENQPSTKFVEAANNKVSSSGKTLHEGSKICEQLYEVWRICQQLYEIHRTYQQLYKVCGTHKKFSMNFVEAATTLQSSWELPIFFAKSKRPAKILWSLYIGRPDLSAWSFSLFKFHSFKYCNW